MSYVNSFENNDLTENVSEGVLILRCFAAIYTQDVEEVQFTIKT